METQTLSRRNGQVSFPRPAAAAMTEAMEGTLATRCRRGLFRGVRLAAAGGLAYGAVLLSQWHLNTVSSDQAYINGPITALRAPIGGVLQLGSWQPGMRVADGEEVFRVENARFGNVEAMAQLNWAEELVDRLRVDFAEAELRYAKQQEVFKHHEALFKQNLMPRIDFIEQEAKVELCRISMDNRKAQFRAAEVRRREIEQQVALQKEAVMTMPFDGVVWSVRGQNGSHVGTQESVIHVLDPKRVWVDAFLHERHADKFKVGTAVVVRGMDGRQSWPGRVESVRAGVGRLDPEQSIAVPSSDLTRRRIAVRVKIETAGPFTASEFYGVGRSVKVTLPDREESSGLLWSARTRAVASSTSGRTTE